MHIIESSRESLIVVVCDDTDSHFSHFCIIYCIFLQGKSIMVDVYMQATSKEMKLISIPETVKKLGENGYSIEDILHALMSF